MSIASKISGNSISFANFKSFGIEISNIEKLKPINIIIGRNNTGKSALIDVIEIFTTQGKSFNQANHARDSGNPKFSLISELNEDVLKMVFKPNTSGGDIGGNHWEFGKKFIGHIAKIDYNQNWQASVEDANLFKGISERGRKKAISTLAHHMPNPFSGGQILRVHAERDVVPEKSSNLVGLSPNGSGLTNLIRKFLTSESLPRSQVEDVLLNDLNSIYIQECIFDHILCKENDEGLWEIFLAERGKGDIRLSQSGSSLKSTFIVLAFFNLIPMVQNNFDWSSIIFAFEEPENNLHPSLLRRLLEYLAAKRKQHDFMLFITTHSPIGIDWSSRRSDSQVIHIKSDGENAVATTAVGASKSYDILDDLDIRASDLLQSNCVVWLEGPTDRIYLRRWLELVSDGELIEGIHYTAMFYGGKLLSHLSMLSDGDDNLISLISINRNSAILIDSDRNPKPGTKRKPRLNLNSTKRRILEEVENVGGFSWVTEGREIENYLSPKLLTSLSGKEFTDPVQYEQIINLKAFDDFKKDKVKLAQKAVDEMTKQDIVNVLDLESKLIDLAEKIRDWNSIS